MIVKNTGIEISEVNESQDYGNDNDEKRLSRFSTYVNSSQSCDRPDELRPPRLPESGLGRN